MILILLSAPGMALLAVVIRVTLGQGVFFCQSRIGQHGRPFNVLKFRTMLPDRRRAQVPIPFPDRRCTHKAKNDPRHTSVGRFLRRWSLDELPQLFNVVRGQMSLIGPRPELPSVVARYEPWQHVRHNVKPGMTGLWQVVARGVDPMEERIDLRHLLRPVPLSGTRSQDLDGHRKGSDRRARRMTRRAWLIVPGKNTSYTRKMRPTGEAMQRVLVTGAEGGFGSGTCRALRACAGRNSDNSKLVTTLGWQPQTALLDGLAVTYGWIRELISG